MPKLIDMKLSAKQSRNVGLTLARPSNPPYPWGLRIHLEDESLKKLSKVTKDFQFGARMKLECEVEVVSINESQNADDDNQKRASVGLQIVKMAI
jgi:hypothetical protein